MLQDVNILLFRLIQINKPMAIPVSFLTQLKYHCKALRLVTIPRAQALTASVEPDREHAECHFKKTGRARLYSHYK